ncbi:hypothetical protein BH10PSE17_BH10PSE17_18380 [soil metagenome]
MGKSARGKGASKVGRSEQPREVGETDVARAEADSPVVRPADLDSQPDDGGSHGTEAQPDTRQREKSDTD